MGKGDSIEPQRYSLLLTTWTTEAEDNGLVPSNSGRFVYEDVSRKSKFWKRTSLLALSLNVLLAGWLSYAYWPAKEVVFPGILHGHRTTAVPYQVVTEYSAHGDDTAEIQALWDDMNTVHGVVAVDHEWAEKQNLLPARILPSDPSKRFYSIEGYHALYCLVSELPCPDF